MNNRVYQGHFSCKRFGQNFLIDQFIINSIVDEINPQPGQAIIEIGPGLGALTKPVVSRMDKIIVIELDRDLALRLHIYPQLKDKLTVIQQDALTVDFGKLAEQAGQPLRIFGNLPYNIATPLIFHLFTFSKSIADMNFMLQKEVVNRLVSGAGRKTYGRLSVIAQYFYQIVSVLEVPPTAFFPQPKVNSAVVKFMPYCENPPYSIKDIKLLCSITKQAFSQRRKTIRNSLGKLFSIEQLTELGVDIRIRAENISISDYCKMANYLTNLSECTKNIESYIND